MSILGSLNSVMGANPSSVVPGFANASRMGAFKDMFGREAKLSRKNRRARKAMRRRGIKAQNALGYAGMFKNQANAAAQAMREQQAMEQVNAVQNSVPNTVDAQPVVQQPSAYDPLTQFNPADLEPTMGAALMPASNEMANLQDPATRNFGIAGLGANAMFGGPLARQRSMSNKYIKK